MSGVATALFAATVALVQTDIKKVLAWSTISQLGYMFLALGVGAWGVAVFHLYTHAFFKACLFLGAGSVIHALGGEQDIRKMGGLAKRIPVTFWTFAIATAAIAGIPPLAGFWSKDEILWFAFASPRGGSPWLWVVGASGTAPQPVFDADLTVPLALVLGAEGKGLRRLTQEKCDYLVRLPMSGAVDSLNVSVAAGVLLYEALRQRASAADAR